MTLESDLADLLALLDGRAFARHLTHREARRLAATQTRLILGRLGQGSYRPGPMVLADVLDAVMRDMRERAAASN